MSTRRPGTTAERSRIRIWLVVAALVLVAAGIVIFREVSRDGSGARGESGAGSDRQAAAAGKDKRPPRLVERRPLEIKGRVVDMQDRPVPGARVFLDPIGRTVTSGPEGEFRFADLSPDPRAYFVHAHTEDASSVTRGVVASASGSPVVLRLRPGPRIEVLVVNARDATPIPGAKVTLLLTNSITHLGRMEVATAGDGVARFPTLPLRTYTVYAEARGFVRAPLLVDASGEPGLAWRPWVALEPGAWVSGRVEDEAGRPVAGAEVWAGAMRPGVLTDGQGKFTWPGLPPGKQWLNVFHDQYATGGQEIDVGAASADIDGVVIRMKAGSRAAGRVVDADDQPVPWALVTVGWPENPERSTRTDADGRFALSGLAADPAQPPGPSGGPTKALVASTDDLLSPPLEIDPSSNHDDLVLRLTHDGSIAGVVEDERGRPIPDVEITYMEASRGDHVPSPYRGQSHVLSDGEGRFSIRGLARGSLYRLMALRPTTANVVGAHDYVILHAQEGTSDVHVVFPAGAKIVGRVTVSGNAPPAFTVRLVGHGGPLSFPGGDGSFELNDVPPSVAAYKLSIEAVDSPSVEVDARVGPGEVVDLGVIDLEPGRPLRGRVVRNEGTGAPGARVFVLLEDRGRVLRLRADYRGEFSTSIPLGTPAQVQAFVDRVGGSDVVAVGLELAPPPIRLALPVEGVVEVTLADVESREGLMVSLARDDPFAGMVIMSFGALERVEDNLYRGRMPPGRYRVRIAHDKDWLIPKQPVSVTVRSNAVERKTIDLRGAQRDPVRPRRPKEGAASPLSP